MNFEKTLTTDLFSTSKRYRVPRYQRGYAWKEKIQIQDFWNDLQEITPENPLYFGTIILQEVESEGAMIFDIVDGQQRITTLSLLFIACRNHAIKNNYSQAPHLHTLIAAHDIARGGILQHRLEPGVNIIDSYKFLVENTEYEGGAFPRGVNGHKARILKSNYLFFKERISAFDEKALGDLLTNILYHSFFLNIKVDHALQAFDIFERTNARGTPLNISDLLKNMLFSNETEITNLTERWDKIVIDSDVRLPRFLKYFDAQFNGHDTGKAVLFPHLKNRARQMGPAQFMDEIEIFSKFYNSAVTYDFTMDNSSRISSSDEFNFLYQDEIFFKRIKRSLEALNLTGVQVPLTFVYAGLRAVGKQYTANDRKYAELKSLYIETLNVIECFHFINNGICTTPTNKPEQLYAVEAKRLTEATTIPECKESLKRVLEGLKRMGLAGRAEFIESFSQITYQPNSNKPLLAYIFDRFNCDPFEKTPNVNLFEPRSETIINRTYEIEHISAVSTWEGDEDTLNSIGNLIVLTQQTNRQVGNKPLPLKLEMYKERRCDHLKPVNEFVEWVTTNGLVELSEQDINSRAELLATKAYDQVWNPWKSEETVSPASVIEPA